MSKAVLISIRPKWCQKIVSGEKTIEVRKTRPRMATPFKCYIYCTRDQHLALMQNQTGTNLIACMDAGTAIPVGGFVGNGMVIGEFVCDRIDRLVRVGFDGSGEPAKYCVSGADGLVQPVDGVCEAACLSREELETYLGGHEGCGLHISGLKVYDTPKELSEFTGLRDTRFGAESYKFKRPPQSWCYVEEM